MDIKDLPKNTPGPEGYAGFLIWQLSNKWEKYINQTLSPFNITQSESFHLIAILRLAQTHSEVTQVDVANATGGSIMNTSKILRKLEKKQWVTRQTSASDSRAKQVTVTEAGIAVSIEIAAVLAKADKAFYGADCPADFIPMLQSLNEKHKSR